MSNWTEIKVTFDEIPEEWSRWTYIFSEFDIQGTVQTDQPPTLAGYVPSDEVERVQSIVRAFEKAGVKSVDLREFEEENWAEAWKQFFKPRRVGERFVVCPTWEDYEVQESDWVIVLDPGEAFGTGDHPTTRGCLELIEKTEIEGKDLADIGCGSGILSIGASFLKPASLVCVDMENNAIEATKENLERNAVKAECFVGKGFEPIGESKLFDIVLSNIISAALINIAPEVSRRMKSGGTWIVSGIILENWPEVLTRANQCGFELVDKFEEGDWIAASLVKSP